jgi:hypothetical protein
MKNNANNNNNNYICFNHNIIYFKDVSMYQGSLLTSILYCVLFYLIYLNF